MGHSVREVGNIMEAVWGKKMNANFGGRNYSEQDIMYAIAPIGKNLELLNWKPNIGIKEGIQILYKDLYDG